MLENVSVYYTYISMSEEKSQHKNPSGSDTPSQGRKNPESSGKAEDKTPAGHKKPKEFGGPKGPEPTRYGDWESGGKCIDF